MKVLVLYRITEKKIRKTIKDHLYSFRNYAKDVEFLYCNVINKIPAYVKLAEYDGIILHYTLLATKWSPPCWQKLIPGLSPLKKMSGIKVAIPQDEYFCSNLLCDFFREHKVETVFTCAYPVDYQVLYPQEKSGLKHYFTTFTGFVDENTLEKIESLSQEIPERNIDIGYRARNLPYWLGHFGQHKQMIAEQFLSLKKDKSLKMDISTKEEDVFYEDNWLRFILRCRTMLGCLGGASLHDPDGDIREKVEEYLQQHPYASFDEVEERCFKGKDGSLQLFALSPRHFECAMAKTCQVLLEDDYHGIFKPGIHYIELKRDFSNLADVLEKVKDEKLCKKIAVQTYEDIVASNKYTYRNFAYQVLDHIKTQSQEISTRSTSNQFLFSLVKSCLWLRKWTEFIHIHFTHPNPIYRIFAAVVPKKIRKKLKPIKNIIVGSKT